MTSPLPCRGSCLLLAVCIGTLLLPMVRAQDDAPMPGEEKEERVRLTAEQKEMAKQEIIRRHRLKQELGDFETPRAYFLAFYEPMIDGNRKDYKRNIEYYKRYSERAQELADRGDEEKAERVRLAAELYKKYAEINRAIVKALIVDGDMQAYQEALDDIPQLEQRIEAVTKNEVQRSWLLPREYEVYYEKVIMARRQRRGNQPQADERRQ